MKKGNKLIQKYKECWFELDELNEYMTYYSDEKSLGNLKCKQLGTISLEGAKMEKDEKNACKFNVKTKAGKVYSLQTSTTEERNEWIAAMNKVRDFAQTASQLLQEWEKDQECHNCIQDLAPIVEKDEMMASSEDDDKQADLFDIQVEDLRGNKVPLHRVVGKVTLVIMLRQFGCMLCRRLTKHCLERRAFFEEMGVSIVAIGNGNATHAKLFKKEFDFPGKIFLDQQRQLYRALNCKRGVKYHVSLKALTETKNAIGEGYAPSPLHSHDSGDPLQLGGLFVLTNKREIIFQHAEEFAGNLPELDLVSESLRTYCQVFPHDTWCALSDVKLWCGQQPANPTANTTGTLPPLLAAQSKNYVYECGDIAAKDNSNIDLSEPLFLNDVTFYRNFFLKTEHDVWFCRGEEDPEAAGAGVKLDVGPFVIAASPHDSARDRYALVLHRNGITKRIVPHLLGHSDKEMLKYVTRQVFNCDVPISLLRHVDSPSMISDKIIDFENRFHVTKYKFGVLYMKDGQTTENDMYSNQHVSKEYRHFLRFLGETISLDGWDKYNGGINSEKTKAVYTSYYGKELLFHVATLLPFDSEEAQQLERKKHVGNDVVVLVYKEGNTQFDPTAIKSQFNHFFLIVQKEPNKDKDGRVQYRLSIATKPNVPLAPPTLLNPIFAETQEFRNYLFSKMINSEIGIMGEIPIFKKKLSDARVDMLREMITVAVTAMADEKKRSSMRGSLIMSEVGPKRGIKNSGSKVDASLNDEEMPRVKERRESRDKVPSGDHIKDKRSSSSPDTRRREVNNSNSVPTSSSFTITPLPLKDTERDESKRKSTGSDFKPKSPSKSRKSTIDHGSSNSQRENILLNTALATADDG